MVLAFHTVLTCSVTALTEYRIVGSGPSTLLVYTRVLQQPRFGDNLLKIISVSGTNRPDHERCGDKPLKL